MTVMVSDGSGPISTYPLDSTEGFELMAGLWARVSWTSRYVYSFTWLGRPIIQLPDDMIRFQEVVYEIMPDVIVETGIAHGGSLIFSASLCKLIGRGRVIGIDLDIRHPNREALDAHPLRSYLSLIEGSSTSDAVVQQVTDAITPGESVLIVLDSNHTKAHVALELERYAPLVTRGSYIIATDGIMESLSGASRGDTEWSWNNPRAAALEFVAAHPEFVIEEPHRPFNEGMTSARVTHWPDAFLRRT